MDAGETLDSSSVAPRRLLDIELHCKDGVIMSSAHALGTNSVVFEKMLFSAVQMEESKTAIIRLDDVAVADMHVLLCFCRFHRNYDLIAKVLLKEELFRIIAIAHRYAFVNALDVLCDRLYEIVNEPTSAELQFADRLDLCSLLMKWSQCIAMPLYHRDFVIGLAEFPLSIQTTQLFANANFDACVNRSLPQCM